MKNDKRRGDYKISWRLPGKKKRSLTRKTWKRKRDAVSHARISEERDPGRGRRVVKYR